MRIHTDVDELHQDSLQVAESGSGLHAETQLLLEVTTKGNLNATVRPEGYTSEEVGSVKI